MRRRPYPIAALWAGAAGGAWGVGLARVLALQVRCSFFLDFAGTGLTALLTSGASLLVWWIQARRSGEAFGAAVNLTPLLLPLADLALGSLQPWRGPVLLLGGLVVAALLYLRARPSPWMCFLLVVGLSLAVYLPDVAPWVGRADTFEFQVVAPRLGIAHPSGYPLYILVGKLFSLLPFGTVAWRVNLTSAICAALAAGALYGALESWSGQTARGATVGLLVPPLALAFSPTLWSRAVEAEVYGLNAFLAALSLWVGVRCTRGQLRSERALPLMGLLVGVGMASHLTLGALLFLFLPLLITARLRPSARSLAAAIGLFLGGLALYLYIPLRWPALNDGETMSIARFLAFVTNAESGGALHPLAFLHDATRFGLILRLLRSQVGWGGLALAAIGVIGVGHRSWPLALGTGLAFAAWVWFNLSFYVAEPDYSAFLIPAHVVLLFWLGTGLALIIDLMRQRADLLLPPALAVAALLPLSRLWISGPALDTSRERAEDAWGRYVLALPIARDAAILADSEKFPSLYYLQQVEGLRMDLDLVMRFDEAGYREELASRLGAGQTVYMARYLPHLEEYLLRSLGPLVEVGTSPLTRPPADATPMRMAFGHGIELVAFDLREDPHGRALWHLTLYWQATAPLERDLEVRLRLVDGVGRAVWTSEGVRPVGGNYPTNAWLPEVIVADYHSIAPPDWLPLGEYELQVALFPRFSDQGVDVSPWCPLAAVPVAPTGETSPLMHQVAFAFGRVWLVGYDVPREVSAESRVGVDLSWADVVGERTGQLEWVDEGGSVVKRAGFALTEGMFRSRHVVAAPAAPGDYHLRIELEDAEARCAWLAPTNPGCDLGVISVAAVQEGLANFDGRILLTGAEVGRDQLLPGEVLPVTLHWRALRELEKDYTVTVQLLGPDGRLYGQMDSWPVQGALPTSGWEPGREIADPYRVPLAPDAPHGRYRVVVGWYLLATMERLPVVNAGGESIADHVVVAEPEVIRP
jgi:hypothetical protein